jgi:YD repeat-containing protein
MTLPASFSVDHLGSAELSVPIDVPPGTSGMMPHLSLNYSSSNGNGYVGVGWTLTGLPAITRCPATIATNNVAGPVTLTSSDVFCFQGQPLVQAQQQSAAGQAPSQGQQFESGQQLIATSGTYGASGTVYTTEIEGFSKIVSHGSVGGGPASFTVYTRSGLIYDFGGVSSASSQVVCTTSPCSNTVMTWMLDSVTDTVGNTINITYLQNASKAYPSTIAYTTNPAQGLSSAYNLVTFSYTTTRADAPTQYLAGQPLQTAWLLNTIVTSTAAAPAVSTYSLAYTSGITGRSRLQSITRTGHSGISLLPMSFTYCDQIGSQCGGPADLLTSFNNGLSGATTLTYALTVHSLVYGQFYPPAISYPTQNLVTPRYVVSGVSAPNGLGGQYLVNYTYYNGFMDLHGRGFLGFGWVWSADPQTNLTKLTAYSQSFPTIGEVTSNQVDYTVPSPWTILKAVNTTYSTATSYNNSNPNNVPRTFPYVSEVVTSGHDLFNNPMPTTDEKFNPGASPDGYGNDTSVVTTLAQNYGGVNTVYTTTGAYAFQNDQAGWTANNGKNWIIGRLTSNQVAQGFTDNNNNANDSCANPNTVCNPRLTTYTVDQNTGFVNTETVEPGSGTGLTLTTTYAYDQYGHKKTATSVGDGQTRVESWTYDASNDPGHEFVHNFTNALNQVAVTTYVPQWGELLTSTDIDSRQTSYTYDDLGRKTIATAPDQSLTTMGYHYCSGVHGGTFAGCPTGGQYVIQTTDYGQGGAGDRMAPDVTVTYDTLDRELASDVLNFNGVDVQRVSKTYNTQLQVASVTRPYLINGGTPQITTYTYDPLNRVTQTNYPDSSWDTVGYVQNSKSITVGIKSGYAGESIYKNYDGRGNLTNSIQGVTESGTFVHIFTTYLYDGFNNLTKVTDNNGNVTAYGYDVLGRKITITDPDAGTRTQTYSAFNDLYWVMDGNKNLAVMTYDLLGRMKERCWTNGLAWTGTPSTEQTSCTNPSLTEINETWSYDPTNGIGELGGETSTDGTGYSAIHTYNSASPTLGLLGTPATTAITIGTQTPFNYSYGYDADNRPFYYSAPSGALPITVRNAASYISSLVDGYGGPTDRMDRQQPGRGKPPHAGDVRQRRDRLLWL